MNIDWTLLKKCVALALVQCENGSRSTALLTAMGTISGTHRYMEKDLLEVGTEGYTPGQHLVARGMFS